ncbi:MAG: hypothetical protein R3257_05615, partial [bacterium]|nr:hypothetical protein [bacterium]
LPGNSNPLLKTMVEKLRSYHEATKANKDSAWREAISAVEAYEAEKYDAMHDTQQALEMGAIRGIWEPGEIRAKLIDAQEEGIASYHAIREAQARQGQEDKLQTGLRTFLEDPARHWSEFREVLENLPGGSEHHAQTLRNLQIQITGLLGLLEVKGGD